MQYLNPFSHYELPDAASPLFFVVSLSCSGTRFRRVPGVSTLASGFRQTGQVPLAGLPAASDRWRSLNFNVSIMHLWQKRCPRKTSQRDVPNPAKSNIPHAVLVASSSVSMHTGHLYAVRTELPFSRSGSASCCAFTASSRCFDSAFARSAGPSTSVRSIDSIGSVSSEPGVDVHESVDGSAWLRRRRLTARLLSEERLTTDGWRGGRRSED